MLEKIKNTMVKSDKKQIGIIWANPYNKNLGVGALAYSSLAIFHDIIKEYKIDAEISILGSSRSDIDSIVINGEKITFQNRVGLNYLSWKSFVKMLIYPGRFHGKKIFGFDYIFDISEGDSFTDIYGDARFERIFNSKKFFSILRKPQILLPQT